MGKRSRSRRRRRSHTEPSVPVRASQASSSRQMAPRAADLPEATGPARSDRGDTREKRPMEPSLLELLAECPRDIGLWLENLGVQTCADVHHMWRSGMAMTEEYEAGEKLPAEQAFKVAMVWTLASRRAAMDKDQAIQTLVSERECVPRPASIEAGILTCGSCPSTYPVYGGDRHDCGSPTTGDQCYSGPTRQRAGHKRSEGANPLPVGPGKFPGSAESGYHSPGTSGPFETAGIQEQRDGIYPKTGSGKDRCPH